MARVPNPQTVKRMYLSNTSESVKIEGSYHQNVWGPLLSKAVTFL